VASTLTIKLKGEEGLFRHGIGANVGSVGLGDPPLVQGPYVLVGHMLGGRDQGRRDWDGIRALAAPAASRHAIVSWSFGG
jgi:hypothetical protein